MRLSKFSTVNRQACLRRLGERPNAKDRDIKRRQLCDIDRYRKLIRGDDGVSTNLVETWKRDYRIPQGTPLSALAANIAMIDFDVKMLDAVTRLGGSYRRYSDDILIVIPPTHRKAVPVVLNDTLKLTTRRLRVNKDKVEIVEFVPGGLSKGPGSKALQYLGFIFDGRQHLLRSSTLAKYYRRLHRAVGSVRQSVKKVKVGDLPGRPTCYKRKLLANMTHLGSGNFIRTYVANAQWKMGVDPIGRQTAHHQRKLERALER